jgi:hypothetical protein
VTQRVLQINRGDRSPGGILASRERNLQPELILRSAMENISQLVESSLARHGVTANFDHLRLQWTNWFRCESSFSVLLAPAKPGLFALGEEVIPPAAESMGKRASSPAELVDDDHRAVGKRMLGLFHISDTDDLGMTLGRLFLPGNPLRERLATGRCFARYAVVEDPAQRQAANAIFQRWMQESAESASGIDSCGADTPVRSAAVEALVEKASSEAGAVTGIRRASKVVEIKPSSSFAWGLEVQEREAEELKRPQPLPSGF